MHPDLIAELAEDRRNSCACGTFTDQPNGLCRRCLARMGWRRCTSRSSRSAVHRSAGRQARGPAWIFAVGISMLRTIGKGARR